MPNQDESAVILIVDDSPETLALLNQTLSEKGFSVLVALSGAQAISICQKITPDLILLDAVMAGMDGFECHRRLRENAKLYPVPVIFMTGLDSSEMATTSLESGAVDYVQKPIRISELCARIKRHISNAKQISESSNILDSRGLSSMVVNANGAVLWYTTGAAALLKTAGIDKIEIAAILPSLISNWLKNAKKRDLLPIGAGISLKFEEMQGTAYVLSVTKKNNKNEAHALFKKKFGLTERESEVLYWISMGKTNKELAVILGISSRTVNKHLESVFSKLMVDNRTSAANLALEELHSHGFNF